MTEPLAIKDYRPWQKVVADVTTALQAQAKHNAVDVYATLSLVDSMELVSLPKQGMDLHSFQSKGSRLIHIQVVDHKG